MKWNEITILTSEQATEMVSNFLHELDAGGVSIEESGTLNKQRDTSFGKWYETPLNDIPEGLAEVKGYFNATVDVDSMVAGLRPRIAELREYGIDPGPGEIEVAVVDDEDWANAWKQYFKPIKVSERIAIKPTWEQYTPEGEEQVIELDPGMAFGTGTHATTTLCLQALDRVVQGGEEVIDVGTGSGILAIGAAKLGASQVLAVDLDPVAISSAAENTRLNGLEAQIDVRLSDLLGVLNHASGRIAAVSGDSAGGWVTGAKEAGVSGEVDVTIEAAASGETTTISEAAPEAMPLRISLPVDIVVANILAEIIVLFLDDVREALKPGGLYIASGIFMNKEALVDERLAAAGFEVVDKLRQEDWVAIIARKPLP